MSKRIISIAVSDIEYDSLIKEAQKRGMNLSQFCRLKLELNTEFDEYYKLLLDRIEKLPSQKNLKFYIRDLWTVEEWNSIPKGLKLTLGKKFYLDVSSIDQNKIPRVSIDGYGSGRTMRYIIK